MVYLGFFWGGREVHIWKVQHLPLVSNVSVLLSLAQSLPESRNPDCSTRKSVQHLFVFYHCTNNFCSLDLTELLCLQPSVFLWGSNSHITKEAQSTHAILSFLQSVTHRSDSHKSQTKQNRHALTECTHSM